jgi:hypothetical protein
MSLSGVHFIASVLPDVQGLFLWLPEILGSRVSETTWSYLKLPEATRNYQTTWETSYLELPGATWSYLKLLAATSDYRKPWVAKARPWEEVQMHCKALFGEICLTP